MMEVFFGHIKEGDNKLLLNGYLPSADPA